MTTSNGRRRAFLAGPFKGILDPETGTVRKFERERYEALISALESRGYDVHNAHKRENWGATMMTPEECTKLDYDHIRDADLFVAFPGAPPSPGTHIEIGWASAMGKPVVLLIEEGTYAFLIRGLHTVGNVTYVDMPANDTGLEPFESALDEIESRQASE